MNRVVRVIEFQRALTESSKWPILCTCSDGSQPLDVIVKLRGKLLRDVFGLAIEHVAALLARDLGLQTAEIVIVDVTHDLADDVEAAGDRDRARLIRPSVGMNIGSVFLGPGWHSLPFNDQAMAKRRVELAQIVAFDFLIQNFDRQASNPNYLRKGQQLILIDHEEAFGHLDCRQPPVFSVQNLEDEPCSTTYSSLSSTWPQILTPSLRIWQACHSL